MLKLTQDAATIWDDVASSVTLSRRRCLPTRDPWTHRNWKSLLRIALTAQHDGVPVRHYLVAAFDRLRGWKGLPIPPPQVLTPAMLRRCHREWVERMNHPGAAEFARQSSGTESVRLMLDQAARTASRWIAWERGGGTLEHFLATHGQTVSPWWLVVQPWWHLYREQVTGVQMSASRRADVARAERNVAHYRGALLRALAKAAQGGSRGQG